MSSAFCGRRKRREDVSDDLLARDRDGKGEYIPYADRNLTNENNRKLGYLAGSRREHCLFYCYFENIIRESETVMLR